MSQSPGTCISILFFSIAGRVVASFTHEMLEHCRLYDPICTYGDSIHMFNYDCSAIITFKLNWKEEQNAAKE